MTRLVKLCLQTERVSEFLSLFEVWAPAIRSQPGCRSMCLQVDVHNPALYFTISEWDNEDALNAYRNSSTFAQVWPATKRLFAAPAQAWSLEVTSF